jgi:hypothetical protein
MAAKLKIEKRGDEIQMVSDKKIFMGISHMLN